MPKSLGGLIGFAVMATVTVVVGTFIYNRMVSPLIAQIRSKAAA